MTANTNRVSTYTTASGGSEGKNGEQKKDMWSSMLDSVASGKRLPEKNILVLGTLNLSNLQRACESNLESFTQAGPSSRSANSSSLYRTSSSERPWTEAPTSSLQLRTTLP